METIFDMPFDWHSSKLHGIDCGDDVLQKRVHGIVRSWQALYYEALDEVRHEQQGKVDEDEYRRLCAEEVTAAIEKRILERHVGLLC